MKRSVWFLAGLGSSDLLKSAALLGLIMLTLAGCATNTTRVTTTKVSTAAIDALPGDRLIVPGSRVGPIPIGGTIDYAEMLLGPGQRVVWDTNPGYPNNHHYKGRYWSRYGVAAYYNPGDGLARITFIDVFSPAWRTAVGVHFGMPYYEAITLMPLSKYSALQPHCFPTYCWGGYMSGMSLQSKSRTGPIISVLVYNPNFPL